MASCDIDHAVCKLERQRPQRDHPPAITVHLDVAPGGGDPR